MGNIQNCIAKSKSIYTEFSQSQRVSLLAIEVKPHTGTYAFRATFNKKIRNANGDIIKGISISVPTDAMGNRGPEEPYKDPIIPVTIETALIGMDDRVMYADEYGYQDVLRFWDMSDVITHLEEFADGALLISKN